MKISELEEGRPGSSGANRKKAKGRRSKAATYKSYKPKADNAPDYDYGDEEWEDTTRKPKQGKAKRKFGKFGVGLGRPK